MVRLTRIYTKGGDQGETSLGDGSRVKKHALRVEAFGTVDEANAAIGLARLHAEGAILEMLARIQHDLFDLGADLCNPETGKRSEGALRILASQTGRLEREIDAMNADLQAARQLHPAGRHAARGAASLGAHHHPPRRAAGHGARRDRDRQSRGGQISQPPLGSSLRAEPGRQSQHRRYSLAPRRQSLTLRLKSEGAGATPAPIPQ